MHGIVSNAFKSWISNMARRERKKEGDNQNYQDIQATGIYIRSEKNGTKKNAHKDFIYFA
jgi:hypothetical protein